MSIEPARRWQIDDDGNSSRRPDFIIQRNDRHCVRGPSQEIAVVERHRKWEILAFTNCPPLALETDTVQQPLGEA